MTTKKVNLRFGVITAIIMLAALSRLVPHPANFAPAGAMALQNVKPVNSEYDAKDLPAL